MGTQVISIQPRDVAEFLTDWMDPDERESSPVAGDALRAVAHPDDRGVFAFICLVDGTVVSAGDEWGGWTSAHLDHAVLPIRPLRMTSERVLSHVEAFAEQIPLDHPLHAPEFARALAHHGPFASEFALRRWVLSYLESTPLSPHPEGFFAIPSLTKDAPPAGMPERHFRETRAWFWEDLDLLLARANQMAPAGVSFEWDQQPAMDDGGADILRQLGADGDPITR